MQTMKTEFLLHWKQSEFIIVQKTSAIQENDEWRKSDAKHVNKLRGKMQIPYVTSGDTCIYHWALKG